MLGKSRHAEPYAPESVKYNTYALVAWLLGTEGCISGSSRGVGNGSLARSPIHNRHEPDVLTSVQVHLFEWSWKDIALECKPLRASISLCKMLHMRQYDREVKLSMHASRILQKARLHSGRAK